MTTLLSLGTIWASVVSILLFIMTTCIVIYYLVYLSRIKRWEQSNIPFLQPTFLIGHKHFLDLAKYSVTLPIDKIYKENDEKDLFGFFIGTIPMVLLRDQKVIRQVFSKTFSQITSAIVLPESEKVGQYLMSFTSSEENWKFTRNKMMPIFSLNWFHGPKFKGIKKAIKDLYNIAENSESNGTSINVTEITKHSILDISSSNFGIESHMQTMKNNLKTIVYDFFEPSYHRMLAFNSPICFPILQMFESFKLLSHKNCKIMSDTVNHLIQQRDQMNIETGAFIDIIQAFKTKHESKNCCSNDSGAASIGEDLTTTQMTAMGLTYILGGSETVIRLLTFAIHTISLYPEYQKKIRTEVQEALTQQGVSEFDFEVIRSLSFTFQCLFETLRLYPPGSLLMRQCLEEFQIPGTNYIFKEGDKLVVPLYSIARDKTQFQDPHLFNPERFKSKGNSLAIPETLLSFGTGPRKCPGYSHGMIVVAALLASLVYKYEIKPRSHLKLMDATDFNTKTISIAPKKDVLVELVRCKTLGEV